MTAEGIGALLGMVGTTKLLGVIYRKQVKRENYRAESRYGDDKACTGRN